MEYKSLDGRGDIKSMTPEEISAQVKAAGLEPYRAKQITRRLFAGLCTGFDEMTELSARHKERLDALFAVARCTVEQRLVSRDGTEKYLFRLADGEYIESVLMSYGHGNTVCISTQAGCRMGCVFCASTKGGFRRNLLPSEMLLQIEEILRERRKREPEFRVSNIVLMGIGEPLDNYDNVLRFLFLVNLKEGLNIGYRHISLSTCGVVPMIRRLALENLPITLSVSLHAADNEKRNEIMPINRNYPLEQLIDACAFYQSKTGRRISFEYALIGSFNDSMEDARNLSKLVNNLLCHVNLIPINEIKEKNFKKTTKNAGFLFTNTLEDSKINVTVRRKLGEDINAACGQLRGERLE